MNASRRYLPLSLMLLLAASVGSANAGSLLDPYSHITAPAGAAPKKRAAQKEPVIVPQADELAEPTTYISMPMGHLAEDDAAKKKKPTGLLGRTMAPFKAASSGVAKSGKYIANGAKASGGMVKKSTTVIGTGLKSTGDKIKDSKDAVSEKIASKPPKDKKDKRDKKDSPNKIASVDDWYTKESAAVINKNDNGSRARDLLKKDPTKSSGIETAFLPHKGGSKVSKFNPFNKLKKPSSKAEGLDIRPKSGFADGAANPDEEVLAELEREKAAKLAAKAPKDGAEKEKFTPIVATPEPTTAKKPEQVASNSTAAGKPAKKKSKLGGLNIAKFKPGMPSLPSFKKGKKNQPTAIAAAPKKDEKNNSELDKLTPVEPVAKMDPAGVDPAGGEEDIAPAAKPAMAFNTGDKKIDGAKPLQAQKDTKKSTVIASTPAKKSKFSGMSFSKLNFLNKKKSAPSQTATKTDAAKQM